MTTLRIGIVGLGVISRFYVAALTRIPSVRLAAMCDRDLRARESVAGGVPCYDDHRTMLASGEVDAVIVTVPNDAHATVCRDALAAGLPVCVEKPLAISAAQGTELVEQARQSGVALLTAFHRRYNSAVLALVERLHHRRSAIETVTVNYLERIEEHVGRDAWYLDPARCGGGCLADNGPNAFDLVRHILGEVQVVAAAVTRDASGVDRQATVELRGHDGGEARVELDWSYPGERKDVHVRLSDGTTDSADMLGGHTAFKGSLWHEYVGIVRRFEEMVRAGAPGAGTDGGLAALELVEAAYEAQRRGMTVPSGGW
ncbi:Gfo/Idh/MocA family protein [Salinactinospora qingdaonensis]|uniref:Gfo/Idh/MocA family oxidoreductase n=1 Tax=Salinactinospora qingdaonensis TaxID=702744 RepID=A0ABP7GCE6_9ACTN